MNFGVIVITADVAECVAIIKWRDMARFYGHYLYESGYYGAVNVVDLSTGEVILFLEQE